MKDNRRNGYKAIEKNVKGFTLVELIVVLVIIAILAALAIPAMLGFIDSTHKKQVVARAQTALTSTQAALSDIYASNDNKYTPEKRVQTRINAGSVSGDNTAFTVWNVKTLYDEPYEGEGENIPATVAVVDEIGSYTVGKAVYKDYESEYAAYNGSTWEVFDTEDEAKGFIALAPEEESSVIYVWPFSDDFAYKDSEKKDTPPDPEDPDEPDALVAKKVVFTCANSKKAFFTSNSEGTEIAPEQSVEVLFYDNGRTDWTCGNNAGKPTFSRMALFYMLSCKKNFHFINWKDTESDFYAVDKGTIASFIFNEENEGKDSFVFAANVALDPNSDFAILSNSIFHGFVGNNIVSGVEQFVGDELTDVDSFLEAHSGALKVDDGSTSCSIYAWYEGNTIKWWTDASTAYLPVNSNGMFKNCTGVQNFDFSGFDASIMEQAKELFSGASALSTLSFGDDFRAEELVDLGYAFNGCSGFTDTLDLSGIKSLGNKLDLASTFYKMGNVQKIQFGEAFKGTKIQSLSSTFSEDKKLKEVDLSGWNVSQVSSCEFTFNNCESLSALKLRNDGDPNGIWALDSCETMNKMFYHCYKLTNDMSEISTGNKLTTIKDCFTHDDALTKLDLRGINPTNIEDMQSTFRQCSKLTEIDVSTWKGDKRPQKLKILRQTFNEALVLTAIDMSEWNLSGLQVFFSTFNGCKAIQSIALPADPAMMPDGNVLRTVAFAFNECNSLEGTIDLSGWKTGGIAGRYSDMNEDMAKLFCNCYKITDVRLSGWDVSNVTNMTQMFYGCKSLSNIDLHGWEMPKLKNITSFFEGCINLETVDLSNWKVPLVTNMQKMFSKCAKLRDVNLSQFYAPEVMNLSEFFSGCIALESVDLSSFTAEKLTDISGMFKTCSSLKTVNMGSFNAKNIEKIHDLFNGCAELTMVDISGLKASKVTDMSCLFSGCKKLNEIKMKNLKTDKVTTMREMFKGCEALTELDLKHFEFESVENVNGMFHGCISLESITIGNTNSNSDNKKAHPTDMGSMFKDCNALKSINLKCFDTEKVTNMSYMFAGCSSLTELNLEGFGTAALTSMNNMFDGCSSLAELDISGWDTVNITSMAQVFKNCASLETINFDSFVTTNVTSMKEMFSGCAKLKTLDLSSFSMSNVKDISNIFSGCSSLASLDISNWNTVNITSMAQLFKNCASLETINVDGIVTTNVTSMKEMFSGCAKLKTLDLSCFSMSNVKDISSMFSGCVAVTNLDLNGWDLSNITGVNGLFRNLSALEDIDISGWQIPKVTNMAEMFKGCSKLRSADLSKIVSSNVTDMNRMFNDCKMLETVDIDQLQTSKVTNVSYMFNNCYSLHTIESGDRFDLTGAQNMENMFANCLKLSGFDTGKIYTSNKLTNAKQVFMGCISMDTISLEHFNFENVYIITGMFNMQNWIPGTTVQIPGKSDWVITEADHKLTLIEFGPQCVDHKITTSNNLGSLFKDCINLTTIKVYPGTNFHTITTNNRKDIFLDDKKLVGGGGTTYQNLTQAGNANWYSYHIHALIDEGENGTRGYFTDATK